jgi:hypothetical protein
MDARLVFFMLSALAPSHRWEVSLVLSEKRLDETWTYCADVASSRLRDPVGMLLQPC